MRVVGFPGAFEEVFDERGGVVRAAAVGVRLAGPKGGDGEDEDC